MGMTINRSYRDALYDGVMTDLTAHGDILTYLSHDEVTEAKRLHHRFRGELGCLMTSVGSASPMPSSSS